MVDSPSWFDPYHFHLIGVWLAVILEENLWASFKLATKDARIKDHKISQIQNAIFRDFKSDTFRSLKLLPDELGSMWDKLQEKERVEVYNKFKAKLRQ